VLRPSHVASFVAGAVAATAVGVRAVPGRNPDVDRFASLDAFAAALHHVSGDYVEPVEERTLVWNAIAGMARTLDVHSTFLPPRRYDRLRQDTEGAFGGVGLTLGPGDADDLMPQAEPWPIVDELVDGSPAARAGLRVEDRIVTVDGRPTTERGAATADAEAWEARTRGASGTRVELGVLRAGWSAPRTFSLVREQVTMPTVEAAVVEPGLGYLAIRRFQEATHDDTRAALARLAAAGALDVLVLDLRGNIGGLLDQGIRVADLFLADGTIVTVRGRRGAVETHPAHAAGTFADVRLVVLVDGNTASAAELLAGALQDHRRGVVMGLPTYGKGSVQTFYDLPDGSGLKLTTARYYTPRGASLEGVGITPDVVVDAFAAEVVVGGPGASPPPEPPPEPPPGGDDAGEPAGNDARILEPLMEDNQFLAAYQTARGMLGSK
jgi:carboxyl-terminal processing protease